MKTKRIFVPKEEIVELFPHPEAYGETIAELKNGMWTDVYSDSNGQYYTLTNDESLQKYLKSIQK